MGWGLGWSSVIPSLPHVGWRGCFQPAHAFVWSGLEILLFLSALWGWLGFWWPPYAETASRGPGSATWRASTTAIRRGHFLGSGSGVRLAADPLTVFVGGVHLWPVWWNLVDTPHSKCGALWGVRVRVPPRVLVC